MPNPIWQTGPRWPNIPLAEHLNGATHVSIRCRCHRQEIWLTSDLVARVRGAVTCNDYQNRLRCSHCGLKGWTMISPIDRR